MMAIEPSEPSLRALASQAAETSDPVVMLNLLKFAGREGAASYQRYATDIQPILASANASVLYAGDTSLRVIGEQGATEWDAVVVVRYPSRTAFLSMVASPEYQAIHKFRTAALESAELIATDPWPVS
jgi:uncharacterized protein (DUF1330 family)